MERMKIVVADFSKKSFSMFYSFDSKFLTILEFVTILEFGNKGLRHCIISNQNNCSFVAISHILKPFLPVLLVLWNYRG